MTTSVLRWAAAVAVLPVLAFAQLVTNVVPRERTVPIQESIDAAMSAAQWRLGGLRLQPQIGVREMGYNDNVYGTDEDEAVEDWTATVFGGMKAYLPLGAKGSADQQSPSGIYLVQRARLPSAFWRTLRRLGVRILQSAHPGGNRVRAGHPERRELGARDAGDSRCTGGSAKFELEIFRRLALFGGVDARDIAYEDPDQVDDPELRFSELGRTESAARAGIRYRWSSFLDVSVLQETTTTEFETAPFARDNESEALLIGIYYDRPKFFLNITGGSRDGSPANGSTFPAYTETTGSWFAEYRLTAPIDIQAFGSRDVVYGLYADNPYFLEIESPGNRGPVASRSATGPAGVVRGRRERLPDPGSVAGSARRAA